MSGNSGATMRTVSLSEFGHSFATCGRAEELRNRLLEALGGNEREVVLDFDGVTHVTYSFADEYLGKLVEAHPELTVRIENAAPSLAGTLERARASRSAVC